MGDKAQSSIAEIVSEIDQAALKLEGTMNDIFADIRAHTSPISPITGRPLNAEEYDQSHNRHILLRNLAHQQRDELRFKIMNLYIALHMDEDIEATRKCLSLGARQQP